VQIPLSAGSQRFCAEDPKDRGLARPQSENLEHHSRLPLQLFQGSQSSEDEAMLKNFDHYFFKFAIKRLTNDA